VCGLELNLSAVVRLDGHLTDLTSEVIESLHGLRTIGLIDRTAQKPLQGPGPASQTSIGSGIMQRIIRRALHHPVLTRSAIYLVDALYRSDWSIGATLFSIAGTLLVHAYRTLEKNNCPIRSRSGRCTLDA
jgi:hypothetical protein